MTTSDMNSPALVSVPTATEEDFVVPATMPRLGHGIVWADVLAEIERDNQARDGLDRKAA